MRSRALVNVLNLVNEEEMPVAEAFLRDLKFSIVKEDEKNIHIASQTYKPSSLHCIRNMYYQLIGETPRKENGSPELIGICESGTDRHERIQWAVEKMRDNGIDCDYVDVGEYVKSRGLLDRLDIVSKQGNETKLYNKELNISFLCDGIIKYNGKYYILEIKTETSNKFWTQSGVMPGHILQGTAYSLCFDIDDVIFLYENRDNCAKKSFLLHVTDAMRDTLRDKIKTCDNYVEQKIAPSKPTDIERKTCTYCNYKESCDRDGE